MNVFAGSLWQAVRVHLSLALVGQSEWNDAYASQQVAAKEPCHAAISIAERMNVEEVGQELGSDLDHAFNRILVS